MVDGHGNTEADHEIDIKSDTVLADSRKI